MRLLDPDVPSERQVAPGYVILQFHPTIVYDICDEGCATAPPPDFATIADGRGCVMFRFFSTHTAVFEDRDTDDGEVWSYRFSAAESLDWQAGQHILLRLPGWKLKPFSVASSPHEGCVLIGTSLQSQSTYKKPE